MVLQIMYNLVLDPFHMNITKVAQISDKFFKPLSVVIDVV